MPTTDTNIKAKIICDSLNPKYPDCRLTTFVCTYPRIILAELNTHRMCSKSTASSRAIPIRKQIEKVKLRPFIPSWIGANQSGMQAQKEVDLETQDQFKQNWLMLSGSACIVAGHLDDIGIHKQISNRLLEPWGYVTSIITATDWSNFFALRAHPNAQPEFMVLAYRMLEAYLESEPLVREDHIPFGDQMEPGLSLEDKRMVACARCARISYETHDGKRDHEEDLRLAKRLIADGHMSPFEHVARANPHSDCYTGNFRGWIQERKKIQGENRNSVNLQKIMDNKPDWV